jgi:hypothetical protein
MYLELAGGMPATPVVYGPKLGYRAAVTRKAEAVR